MSQPSLNNVAFVPNGDPDDGTPSASSSSSVHTHERNEPDLGFLDAYENQHHPCDLSDVGPYQRFRHSGWQRLRQTVYDALAACDATPGTLARFVNCGTFARINANRLTGELCITGCFCRSRFCVPCSTARSRLLQQNLTAFIRDKRCRFLTLTIKHNGDEPLSLLIDRFWQSFKLLRRRDQWTANVSGFAMFLEVKWSDRTAGWHVHGHCLCEGRWWDQKEISRLWHACTGDSFIVDIQAKGTPEQMAYYGAKYATKPLNASDMVCFRRLCEGIKATKGRHLYLIGGEWRGRLKLTEKPTLNADWEEVCSADLVWRRASEGDEQARLLMEAVIGLHGPSPPPASERPPPRTQGGAPLRSA